MGTGEHDADLASRFDNEIRLYVQLRRNAEEVEDKAKKFRRQADEQRDRLFDLLESAGIKTISHEMGRITRTVRIKALIDDREALRTWLEDQGMLEAFTRQDFRQANLNELVKEKVEGGEELPSGTGTLAIKGITFTAKR